MIGRTAHRVRATTAHEVLRLATLIATAAFLADWATKSWAESALSEVALPFGVLTLAIEHNDAFAFSSGAGRFSPMLIVAIRLAALAAVVYLSRQVIVRSQRCAIGVGLLIAGGAGNAADLVFRGGAVVDFIGAGPFTIGYAGELLHTAFVFNLADVAILIGLGLIAPEVQRWARAGQRVVADWEARWLAVMSRLMGRQPGQQSAD